MAFLEKHLNILDYSLSSIWQRRARNLRIILVFTGVIFLISSFQMLTTTLTQTAMTALEAAPEITIQKMVAGRQQSIPQSYTAHLDKIFGIRQIVPRIWGYYFDETSTANYTVVGLDTSLMPLSDQLPLTLSQGRLPADNGTGEVVLAPAIKKILAPNRRTFSLFRPDLSLKTMKVSGVFPDEANILTGDLITMNLADSRDLFQIPAGEVTDLCVYVANPAEIGTIADKISKALPDTRVVTRPQIKKTYQVVFSWRSGFASICLLTALAAFVIFSWDKASGLMPEEKREIAILKILGWQTGDIIAIRFWEGFIIATLAFILGYGLGFVHISLFNGTIFTPLLTGWSVLQPELHLTPRIKMNDLFLIFIFSVIPYLTATIIPAWRSAAIPPDSAIN